MTAWKRLADYSAAVEAAGVVELSDAPGLDDLDDRTQQVCQRADEVLRSLDDMGEVLTRRWTDSNPGEVGK